MKSSYGERRLREDYETLRSNGSVEARMTFGPGDDIEAEFWWWDEMATLARADGIEVSTYVDSCGAGSYYMLGMKIVPPEYDSD